MMFQDGLPTILRHPVNSVGKKIIPSKLVRLGGGVVTRGRGGASYNLVERLEQVQDIKFSVFVNFELISCFAVSDLPTYTTLTVYAHMLPFICTCTMHVCCKVGPAAVDQN